MKLRIHIFLLFFSAILLTSCGGLKGEFALKKFGDEFYRKIDNRLQFDSREKINWIFKFRNISGRHRLGVIILKKDISWIDISKKSDYADSEKPVIYGEIAGLPPGKYRILLTDIAKNNRQIAQLDFSVFTEEE